MYVPQLKGNLLSVKKLIQNGTTLIFKENLCTIYKNKTTLAKGILENGLYMLYCVEKTDIAKENAEHEECIHLRHRRLGHRDPEAIKKLIKNDLATGIKIKDCKLLCQCVSCAKGKLSNKSYQKRVKANQNKFST